MGGVGEPKALLTSKNRENHIFKKAPTLRFGLIIRFGLNLREYNNF